MSDPNSTSTSPTSSPIEPAEVELTGNTDSISELFARDPLEWDDAAMDRMIAHYRKQRVLFKEAEAKGKTKAPKAAKIPAEDLKGISGDDLLGKLGL